MNILLKHEPITNIQFPPISPRPLRSQSAIQPANLQRVRSRNQPRITKKIQLNIRPDSLQWPRPLKVTPDQLHLQNSIRTQSPLPSKNQQIILSKKITHYIRKCQRTVSVWRSAESPGKSKQHRTALQTGWR